MSTGGRSSTYTFVKFALRVGPCFPSSTGSIWATPRLSRWTTTATDLRERAEKASRHREISAYMISIHVVHRSGQYREVYTHLQRHASRDPNQPILHSQRPAALGTSLLVCDGCTGNIKDRRSKKESVRIAGYISCKSKHEIKLQQHKARVTKNHNECNKASS